MNIWILIVIATTVTAVLRIAPIYFSKTSLVNHPTFVIFLDYSACAAIGCMIYLSAFSQFKFGHFLTKDYILFAINIGVLLFAFSLSLYLRRPVTVFIICILIYATVLYIFHPF